MITEFQAATGKTLAEVTERGDFVDIRATDGSWYTVQLTKTGKPRIKTLKRDRNLEEITNGHTWGHQL